MKQGRSIDAIRDTLQLQADLKKDYDISPFRLELTQNAKLFARGVSDVPFDCTTTMHNQIAQRTGIPVAYYNRMLEYNTSLLAQNVNSWLRNGTERHFTLRTFQGSDEHTARALLSDRYRMVDHLEVTNTVTRILGQCTDLHLASAELTEDRLYYKYIFPKVQGEIKKGDVVQAGFVITNSETGMGACSILPFLYRLVCTNGMIIGTAVQGFKKYHIGKNRKMENDITIYADEYQDELLSSKIENFITTRLNDETFEDYFDRMRQASEAKAKVSPGVLFERVAKKFSLTDSEKMRAMSHYMTDGDHSLYGLSNAITRTAQDMGSYDRASEMEAIGWNILTLDNRSWGRLNEAA